MQARILLTRHIAQGTLAARHSETIDQVVNSTCIMHGKAPFALTMIFAPED
jgi:hypothetical protein